MIKNKYLNYLLFFFIISISFMINVDASVKVNINPKTGCHIISNDLKEWLQWILDVIRIGGIVLAVVLGMWDYVDATFASDDNGMKKANNNLSMRLISIFMLFLAPIVISFLIDLVNLSFGSNDPTCGIK